MFADLSMSRLLGGGHFVGMFEGKIIGYCTGGGALLYGLQVLLTSTSTCYLGVSLITWTA